MTERVTQAVPGLFYEVYEEGTGALVWLAFRGDDGNFWTYDREARRFWKSRDTTVDYDAGLLRPAPILAYRPLSFGEAMRLSEIVKPVSREWRDRCEREGIPWLPAAEVFSTFDHPDPDEHYGDPVADSAIHEAAVALASVRLIRELADPDPDPGRAALRVREERLKTTDSILWRMVQVARERPTYAERTVSEALWEYAKGETDRDALLTELAERGLTEGYVPEMPAATEVLGDWDHIEAAVRRGYITGDDYRRIIQRVGREHPERPDRPVWFLDIDGTLSPIPVGDDVSEWTDFLYKHAAPGSTSVPYRRDVIDGVQGMHESGLVEVRWLTTWPDDLADGWMEAGLGPFRVGERFAGTKRGWKANSVAGFLAANPGRRVIWTDDHAGRSLRDLRGDRLLVIAPDPAIGLTTDDLDRIQQWVRDPDSVSHRRK